MSELIRTEEIAAADAVETSRRTLLRNLALVALAGPLTEEAAGQVHQHVAEAKKKAAGVYKPKYFTAHEFETLAVLSEMIIPGARAAGAAEFVDLLASNNMEFAAPFSGGMLWLDHEFERRFQTDFLKAGAAQRKEVLDVIAYRKNATPELGPGIEFFDLARRMAADAYFTSREGVKAIGFMGNGAAAKFEVPAAVLEYVNGRSPV